ncbi:MAG: aminotransferase class I/II-fold pyridoxal phosphate-dependent enzyme [Eggerthellaceae bacterium]|nr:aminotransferase class I/II-fold pyridoxal phosphate-dependent enzyme [Eggerthellaceae bacterium]
MHYDFDFETMLDRIGKDAMAVESLGAPGGFAPGAPKEGYDAIPMWVADMNFPTAPSVTRAIIERAQHPAFGYYRPSDAYFKAIIGWHERRHGVTGIQPHHIGYQNGVLGGLASACGAFTSPGDKVLVNSPTYIGFTHAIERCGRFLELSPLVRDDEGVWRMDFEDMARRIEQEHISLAVLCSPYNPCGRVWERWELERAAELFAAHDVVVVVDEIWSDIILPGYEHISFHTISEDARMRSITLNAPSKTFNLAGLIGSYDITFNDRLRERLYAQGRTSYYNDMNVLSMHALIGGYSDEGSAWVDGLNQVLGENVRLACDFIDATEGLEAFRPQGTYMIFVDCTQWCQTHGRTIDELERSLWDVGVAVQDGRMFHGPCHIRMNLALPTHKVKEALERMGDVLK